MILYTPVAYEAIFPTELPAETAYTYAGKTIYARETDEGELQIVRLMSTDPADYLNPDYSPGAIIDRKLNEK